jgi:Domain of unknown function (DUF4276)
MILAGLLAEGSTDNIFLENIVKKTLYDIAFECKQNVETDLTIIAIDKTGLNFVEQVLAASKKGIAEYGINVLCVHVDADNTTIQDAYNHRINPAKNALQAQNDKEYCKILVAIVPVQEIEGWMLVDKDLLKRQLMTNKSDIELGIHRSPESVANPKETIENAIRIARQGLAKKRRGDLTIAELYLPISQELELKKLEILPSYQLFKEEIRNAFKELNLLY